MSYITNYRTPVPFDDIRLISDGEFLTGLYFIGSPNAEKHSHGCQVAELPIFQETHRWLDCYFSGRQPDFTPRYKLEGVTPFRSEVTEILCTIPFGETRTYGEVAAQIAQRHGVEKLSAQAVGGAVGWNPICLIIPCHRVLGSGGKLTGYSGGLNNKIALLRQEGILVK